MRIPKAVLAKVLALVEEVPRPELAPRGPSIIGYSNYPDVPDVFARPLDDKTMVSYEVATTPSEAGKYAISVTHETGWAFIKWVNPLTNQVENHLWYAGYVPLHISKQVTSPYPPDPRQLVELLEATKMARHTVEAALCNVGPEFAHDSLRLLEWLAKRSEATTWPEFRNDVSWLWYWCQFSPGTLAAHLWDNPVIGIGSPNIRVVMYGAKCAALA